MARHSGQHSGRQDNAVAAGHDGSPPGSSAGAFPSLLLGAGLAIGVYAMLPAFIVRVHTAQVVEMVDHVVPGLLVLSLVLVATLRRAQPAGLMAASGALVTLAGSWMVVTHLGLLNQALHGEVAWWRAAFHVSTALGVLLLGCAWLWRYRDVLRTAEGGPAGENRPRGGDRAELR